MKGQKQILYAQKLVEDEYTNNFVDDLVNYWKDSYKSEHEYKS